MVVSISVIYPHDHMNDWELRFTATGQHQKSIISNTLAWEEIKIQNSEYSFYWVFIAYAPLQSQKTLKLLSEQPSVFFF